MTLLYRELDYLDQSARIQYTHFSMPITKQAAKKLRRDQAIAKTHAQTKITLHKLVKTVRKSASPKSVSTVFQALDKAAKHHLIHPNKAARLKSRLSKLLKK